MECKNAKLGQLGLQNPIGPSNSKSDDGIGQQINDDLDSDNKSGF